MYSFKDEFSTNEPSIRVGNRIPQLNKGVNLAYVNAPELVSEDTVECFDYSKQLPENISIVDEFKSDFFTGDSRMLTDRNGVALVPIENTLISSYYKKLADGTWIPMFYKYTCRFKHFEKDPPLTTVNAPSSQERVYAGHNIVLLKNNEVADQEYIVTLEHIDGDPEYLYLVHVYSEISSSETDIYVVEYSRWNATKQSVSHNYEEVYNSEGLFVKTDKETVMSAPDGTKIYALEKFIAEDGYRVYAAEDSDLLSRTPVLIRWRIKDGQGRYSVWKSDTLLWKQSLYRIEDYVDKQDVEYAESDYTTKDGTTVYYDEDTVAKKILCPNLTSLFETSSGPYTVEYQIWDEATSTWIPDVQSKAFLNITGSTVTGYTTENTGNKIDSPGTLRKVYPTSVCDLTIEAWLDPPDVTHTPIISTNVSKLSSGASITTDLNPAVYPQYSNPEAAIGGSNPFSSVVMGAATDVFYVRSNESTSPPTIPVKTTVSLAKPTTLHKIEVVLGAQGTITKLEVRKSDNSTVTVWNSPPSQGLFFSFWFSGRRFLWEVPYQNGISDVTEIILTITPTVWYTRSYYNKKRFLWQLFGKVNLYQSGFDLYEINAYNYYDPPEVERNWMRTETVGIAVTKSTPLDFELKELLEQYNLVPQDPELQDSLENVHYRITLGDITGLAEATPVGLRDYDPYVTMTAYQQSFGNWEIPPGFKGGRKQVAAKESGSIEFDYNQVFGQGNNVSLKISTDKETALFARKFSVRTADTGKIYMLPFKNLTPNQLWCPRFNNGRISRKNITTNTFFDYYLPEYAGQAFYPDLPYMYVNREESLYVDGTTIQIANRPLHVVCDSDGNPTNLDVYLDINNNITHIPVLWWNKFTGEIKLDRKISETDRIYVDYYYICNNYIYRGWGDSTTGTFYALDINPRPGHTYIDNNGVEQDSINLLDKSIWFYMCPAYVYNYVTGETEGLNIATIKHTIVDRTMSDADAYDFIHNELEDNKPGVIVLAKIDIKRPSIPSMIEVTDSRRRGGGISDYYSKKAIRMMLNNGTINPESEADSVFDIGSWDGLPYPCNGVIEITLPGSILKDPSIPGDSLENVGKFTREEIKEIIDQHVAFGVYTFIRFDYTK